MLRQEWFEVAQALRQRYMINVFFAAIPIVALERFNEDADILADLAHLQEQQSSTVGPETSLGRVRGVIFGGC